MAEFSLNRVVNINISLPERGLQPFNTSNLALITSEIAGSNFSGHKTYFDTNGIGTDFGTTSVTYQMAQSIFSQSPNILTAGGSLIVIKKNAGETLAQAIERTDNTINYFGVLSTDIETQVNGLAAALVVQGNPKILGLVSRTPTDLDSGGYLDLIRSNSYTHTRGLFYQSSADIGALRYSAAYFGRALSTNFDGVNTVQTMNLKRLVGINADDTISTDDFLKAGTAGVDVYVSFEGEPRTYTSGANNYFDEIYNLEWLESELRVNLFNHIARTQTKIPQTEEGINSLKSVITRVLNQGVINGFIAPGAWNNPDTFGNLNNFHRAIQEVGFYIYSLPISRQDEVDRTRRFAPLIQVAVKEAGAIHSASIIVNISR